LQRIRIKYSLDTARNHVGRYDQGEDQQGQMKVDVKHLFDEDGSSLHHHGGVEGHADENDRGDEDLYRPGLIV
jgi:hypothetical protein